MPDPAIVRSEISSPLGPLIVACIGEELIAVDFDDYEDRFRTLITKGFGTAEFTGGAAPEPVIRALNAYFDGDVTAIDRLPTRLAGTDFQRQVWNTLREIPAGETWTYGQLAAHIGRPSAVRAVGRTNGLNPIGIVHPCHRVIGADGTLTGYAGGLHRKEALLKLEGAAFRPLSATDQPQLL